MTPSRYTACIGRRAVYDVRKVAGSTANKRSDVLGAGSNIQRGAVACGRIDIDFRPLVIDIIGNAADDGSVGGDILQRHIDLLTRVSRDGPLIAGGGGVGGGTLKVIEVGCSVGSDIARPRKEFHGILRGYGGADTAGKSELPNRSRLCGGDGRGRSINSEPLLDLRHGLLGGADGELLGHGL